MGLRQTLFGPSKVGRNLDRLKALPEAARTLASELDIVPSGHAGLCLRALANSPATSDENVASLLTSNPSFLGVTTQKDDVGCTWLLKDDLDEGALVATMHDLYRALIDAGCGERLLCSVFGFVPRIAPGEGSVLLVFLHQQETWYPFAPVSDTDRNSELELRVRTFLGPQLAFEKDLGRWMALWGLPVR